MPDAACIKAGGIDDKKVRDFEKTGVEFYCKDRMGYAKAVEGAEQKPVSWGDFFLVSVFGFDFFRGFFGGGKKCEETGGERGQE